MNRLKTIRLAAGMTQEQLACTSGVKISTLQKMESGFSDINGIRLGNALKLAQALGVAVEELVKAPEEE